MKKSVYLSILCLQCFCAVGTSATDIATRSVKKRPEKYEHLKNVIDDLQNQDWMEDEVLCAELLMKIMKNVQNSTLWATWIWDSMQNPVGHLYGSRNNYGNYDECLEFPWEKVDPDMRTQYCLAHIHLSEEEPQIDEVDLFGNVKNYIRTKTKHHLKFNSLNWGICTPVACKPQSVTKFVSLLFRHTHLGLSVDKPNIFVHHCDVGEDKEMLYDMGFHATLLFLVFAVVFTLLATRIVNSNDLGKTFKDFFKAFHIPTNIKSLTKVTDHDVRSFFGIRAISCCIVVGLHVFWFMKSGGISNAVNLDKDYDIITAIVFTSEMGVDTFLFMSGFLFIKALMRDGSEKFNPLKVIAKRYIRIIWLIGVILLGFLNLFKCFPRGPATYTAFGREIEICHKNWWASLLMIHNYFDTENMCHPVIWSTAVDFHLSVLATVMSWVFLKNRRAGLLLFLIGFMISIIAPAAFVYSDYRGFYPLVVDFRLSDDYRKTIFLNKMYIYTHFRAGSYFVGMAVGYVMFKYNPTTYRNIISKKYSIWGFCLFLAMLLGTFVIGNVMLKRDYSPAEVASYLSLKRIVWAILIGMLIIICEYGTLPLINTFLSWSAWAPISKLSYGIYLVHPIFVYYCPGLSRSPNQYDLIGLMLDTCGITVLSTVISLFLWTFFEAPLQNLISLLFRSGNKEGRRDIIKEHNGNQTKNIEH